MGDVLAESNDDFTEKPVIKKKRGSFFSKLKFKKKDKQKKEKEVPKIEEQKKEEPRKEKEKEKAKSDNLSVDEEGKEKKVSIVEGAEPEVACTVGGRRVGLAERNETERTLVKDKLHDTILDNHKNDFGF